MKTVVILPTYNEVENLREITSAILDQGVPGLEILVVDDNSPDGTGALADTLAGQHPGIVHVLHRPGKQGMGRAYIHAFKHVLAMGADTIAHMDCDFSHPPEVLPRMIEKLADYDVVIGSRYVPGGGVDERWGMHRRLLSRWGSRVYAPLILGLSIHDATGGFKAFRREALAAIDLDTVRSNGYAFQVEMNYICDRKGFRIYELPFVFRERIAGTSKMSWRIGMEAMWRVWQIRFLH